MLIGYFSYNLSSYLSFKQLNFMSSHSTQYHLEVINLVFKRYYEEQEKGTSFKNLICFLE